MNIKEILRLIILTSFLSILSISCVSRKKIAYFQNDYLRKSEFIASNKVLTIKPQDRLTISVAAQEQDAAIPFNLPVVALRGSNIVSANAAPILQIYTVDSKGDIDFPVLGKIHVEDLSIEELKSKLTNDISKFVLKPIVSIEIVNFRISILGEVLRPGTYTVNDQFISLPNALGLAGDLTIYGKRNNILVIREESYGEISKNYLDISQNDIMSSPYYYLKQNDVVYVEPNRAQRQGAKFNRNTGVYVSVVSVLISLVVLFTR